MVSTISKPNVPTICGGSDDDAHWIFCDDHLYANVPGHAYEAQNDARNDAPVCREDLHATVRDGEVAEAHVLGQFEPLYSKRQKARPPTEREKQYVSYYSF